jgi:hypothetical protein
LGRSDGSSLDVDVQILADLALDSVDGVDVRAFDASGCQTVGTMGTAAGGVRAGPSW